MGGFGSGWPWWKDKKTTVEECRQFDALRLYQENLLKWGQHWRGAWGWRDAKSDEVTSTVDLEIDTRDRDRPWLRIHYTITKGYGKGQKVGYKVGLETTAPHFGGQCWWLICPGESCGRRVRKLYLPPRGVYFACRHCHDLTYRSCQESDKRVSRLLRRFGNNPAAVLDAALQGKVDLIMALKVVRRVGLLDR